MQTRHSLSLIVQGTTRRPSAPDAVGYSVAANREGLLPTYVIRQKVLAGAHLLKAEPA